jgi:hypothetical protein
MGKAEFLARQQVAVSGDEDEDLTTAALAANDGSEVDGEFESPDAIAEELERLHRVTNAAPEVKEEPEEEDPYEVLQRQFDELQAERDGIAAQRANEQRRIQELEKQQAAAQASEIENHRAIIEHAIAATNTEIEEAKRAYRQAREMGDIEAELAATEILADAKDKFRQLQAGHAEIVRRMESTGKPQPQQAAQADQVEAYIDANFANPKDRDWLRQHKTDIFGDAAKQKLALAGHDIATLKHKIAPGSDEYYRFMDEHMGYAGPKTGGARQSGGAAPQAKPAAPARQKPAPSAPPSRSVLTSGKSPTERASPKIAALAEAMGMSPSKYMENLKAIRANGGVIPGNSGRR